jgi:predicted transcriptional regulator
LGQLEATVMERLWAASVSSVAVRDVLEDLQKERAIAYTTVMTVLDNLHRKGMVTREKAGRAYRYRPAYTREEHTAALMEQVLDGSGDRGAALMHFVEQMPPDEIRRLRQALEGFEPEAGGDSR